MKLNKLFVKIELNLKYNLYLINIFYYIIQKYLIYYDNLFVGHNKEHIFLNSLNFTPERTLITFYLCRLVLAPDNRKL